MKKTLPVPIIIGVVVAVVVVLALFLVKGAVAEPQTPHPDRSKMMGHSAPASNSAP